MSTTLILALCALSWADPRRLVSLAPNRTVSLTTEQWQGLIQRHVHFFDITNADSVDHLAVPAVPPLPQHLAFAATVAEIQERIQVINMADSIAALSSLKTRFFTSPSGILASKMVKNMYERVAIEQGMLGNRVSVNYWNVSGVPQPCVITRVHGRGPNKDQVVILGGHLDSTVGSNGQSRSPGADDDASGISTTFEVYRTIINTTVEFDRTIEFHAYAAEEVGLLGSQSVAEHYKKEGIPVFSYLQNDMTGYVKPGTKETFGIITDYTDASLNAFIRKVVDKYTDISWADSKCGYACSDHASWTKHGYRASFAFESKFSDTDPFIHTSKDELQHLSLHHLYEFAKLGIAYVVEAAVPHDPLK